MVLKVAKASEDPYLSYPYKLPHRGPVSLFFMGLAALIAQTAAGERSAVQGEVPVEEGAIDVGIEAKEYNIPVNGLPHRMLAAIGKDLQLTPAGIHVHGGQGI